MDQNRTSQNGNFQLFVAYMGPLATLSCHLEELTPLTPVAIHRVGFKFTHKANSLGKIMKKKVCYPRTNFYQICT